MNPGDQYGYRKARDPQVERSINLTHPAPHAISVTAKPNGVWITAPPDGDRPMPALFYTWDAWDTLLALVSQAQRLLGRD